MNIPPNVGISGGITKTRIGRYPQMALTDTAVRTAKPESKQRKLSDEKGLFLLVTTAGAKYWRMKYRYGGKEKTLALGVYPDVSLKAARIARDDARKLLSNGVDPSAVKKAEKASRVTSTANSFKAVSIEWLGKKKAGWSGKYYDLMSNRIKNYVYPHLGALPVAEVRAPIVLATLRKLESGKRLHTAKKVRQAIGMVMRYAVATGRADADPTPSLKGAIESHVGKHMASVTDPVRVGAILRMFDEFDGTPTVRCALLLAPLLFCRPGELRQMRWAELDMVAGIWSLERGRMKMRREHLVPLSKQAKSIIEEMRPYSGHLEHVFPNARDPKRAMSDAAVNAGMRRLGIDTQNELTGHGFRAMARTILRERLKYDAEIIECQLSHTKKGALGGAYDRAQFIDERIKMMQGWANYLDDLRAGGKVLRMPGTAA